MKTIKIILFTSCITAPLNWSYASQTASMLLIKKNEQTKNDKDIPTDNTASISIPGLEAISHAMNDVLDDSTQWGKIQKYVTAMKTVPKDTIDAIKQKALEIFQSMNADSYTLSDLASKIRKKLKSLGKDVMRTKHSAKDISTGIVLIESYPQDNEHAADMQDLTKAIDSASEELRNLDKLIKNGTYSKKEQKDLATHIIAECLSLVDTELDKSKPEIKNDIIRTMSEEPVVGLLKKGAAGAIALGIQIIAQKSGIELSDEQRDELSKSIANIAVNGALVIADNIIQNT